MEDLIEILCSNMDKVMAKYIGSNIPPQVLTDPNEITAILAGMGEADFEPTPTGVKIISKRPCSVYWDGSKFELRVLVGKK